MEEADLDGARMMPLTEADAATCTRAHTSSRPAEHISYIVDKLLRNFLYDERYRMLESHNDSVGETTCPGTDR